MLVACGKGDTTDVVAAEHQNTTGAIQSKLATQYTLSEEIQFSTRKVWRIARALGMTADKIAFAIEKCHTIAS